MYMRHGCCDSYENPRDMPSGAKKREVFKEKKCKDLAELDRTPRMNCFFPAKLSSSNGKEWRLKLSVEVTK